MPDGADTLLETNAMEARSMFNTNPTNCLQCDFVLLLVGRGMVMTGKNTNRKVHTTHLCVEVASL